MTLKFKYSLLILMAAYVAIAVAYSLWVPATDSGNVPASGSAGIGDNARTQFNPPVAVEAIAGREDDAVATQASAVPRTKRAEVVANIEAASESFRNTTFLVAIQEAGFVCEVVSQAQRVTETGDNWRVECPRSIAFALAVDESGTLRVTAIPDSFDGNMPFVMPISPLRRQLDAPQN